MKIVITGTSRGLGHAMVTEFIARGHQVHGCARSSASIEQLAERYGSPHTFHTLDVTNHAAVDSWAAEVLQTAGAPDLLLNNAALINQNATLWQVPVAEFDQVVDVNIKGMFYVIRAFVPAMIEAGRGLVVNFSSTWGRTVSPEVAPYCATKWSVEGLTRALAKELPTGLAAIPLNPGVINTDMLRSCFGSAAGGFPTPESWAQQAVPYILQLSTADNGKPCEVPRG